MVVESRRLMPSMEKSYCLAWAALKKEETMKISTVEPIQIVRHSKTLQSAIQQLQTGEIQQVNVPIASVQDLLAISQHMQNISTTQIENISNSNVNVHLHFDDHPVTQEALTTLTPILKPSRLQTGAELV